MPRKLEDVLALRDLQSGMMRKIMKEIEDLLYRNRHMCYTEQEIKVVIDYPDKALPLAFVLHAMMDKDEWLVESPVKGWYRSSRWEDPS